MTIRNLEARYDGRNSFYGKAKVIEEDDGSLALKSYDTIVMRIVNGTPIRLWDGYSSTTMRHVNEFMRQNGFPSGGKKAWDEMPVMEMEIVD